MTLLGWDGKWLNDLFSPTGQGLLLQGGWLNDLPALLSLLPSQMRRGCGWWLTIALPPSETRMKWIGMREIKWRERKVRVLLVPLGFVMLSLDVTCSRGERWRNISSGEARRVLVESGEGGQLFIVWKSVRRGDGDLCYYYRLSLCDESDLGAGVWCRC